MKTFFKKYAFTLMETLIVVAIFGLIISASYALLLSGRFSAGIGESRLSANQSARQAIDSIIRELRLSHSSRIWISDKVGADIFNDSGTVVNFQIPVLKSDGSLDLTADYAMKWGSQQVEGQYLAYHVDTNSHSLLKTTYAAINGSGVLAEQVIAPNISSIKFTKSGTNFIQVEISSRTDFSSKQATQTLHSSVKLRND